MKISFAFEIKQYGQWGKTEEAETTTATETALSIVTWSRRMISQMLQLMILRYRLKLVINYYVVHCPIFKGVASKCIILNGHQIILKNQNCILLTCNYECETV